MIETPKGKIIIGANGKAELKFNPNFAPKWTRRYSKAQEYVDSEVLSRSEKYTPLKTGMLKFSNILGTDVGSGTVQWIAPYARQQYYRGRKPGESKEGPLRGRYWFERMKQAEGNEIIKGAKQRAGES